MGGAGGRKEEGGKTGSSGNQGGGDVCRKKKKENRSSGGCGLLVSDAETHADMMGAEGRAACTHIWSLARRRRITEWGSTPDEQLIRWKWCMCEWCVFCRSLSIYFPICLTITLCLSCLAACWSCMLSSRDALNSIHAIPHRHTWQAQIKPEWTVNTVIYRRRKMHACRLRNPF